MNSVNNKIIIKTNNTTAQTQTQHYLLTNDYSINILNPPKPKLITGKLSSEDLLNSIYSPNTKKILKNSSPNYISNTYASITGSHLIFIEPIYLMLLIILSVFQIIFEPNTIPILSLPFIVFRIFTNILFSNNPLIIILMFILKLYYLNWLISIFNKLIKYDIRLLPFKLFKCNKRHKIKLPIKNLNTLLFTSTQINKSQVIKSKNKMKNILDDESIALKSTDVNKEVIKNNDTKITEGILGDIPLTPNETGSNQFSQLTITENLHSNQPINITNQHTITNDLLDTNLV
jgi:hypothetical protein